MADIAHVPTAAGFLHLAAVLNAWSRNCAGWATASHVRAEMVAHAMGRAVGQRRPRDITHHSDSQKIGASSRVV